MTVQCGKKQNAPTRWRRQKVSNILIHVFAPSSLFLPSCSFAAVCLFLNTCLWLGWGIFRSFSSLSSVAGLRIGWWLPSSFSLPLLVPCPNSCKTCESLGKDYGWCDSFAFVSVRVAVVAFDGTLDFPLWTCVCYSLSAQVVLLPSLLCFLVARYLHNPLVSSFVFVLFSPLSPSRPVIYIPLPHSPPCSSSLLPLAPPSLEDCLGHVERLQICGCLINM